MNLFGIFFFYNYFSFNLTSLKNEIINKFFKNTFFLTNYFFLNEMIWQEGLLLDFLQKKTTDAWIKKFLIYSSYLFNERLVFDKIIKFYLDMLIIPLHKFSIFEFQNVSNILFITVFFFYILFLIFGFFYFLMLMF